ncbi:MAG: V-type ATP synthase subunit I, partial [Acutalibacteraceae bacterium]
PKAAISQYEKEIEEINKKLSDLKDEIRDYSDQYNDVRFLSDYCTAQKDKYEAISCGCTTNKTIYFVGYVPERKSEELKFEIERRFTAQLELYEPDYENDDVPVLIENNSFAAGVESISTMYSPVSNDDVDPNPIMSFFYYALFGLMLADGGYGILMVIFALVAKYKVKVIGNMRKNADFVLWCGVSTIIWGALFGSWFGDLIPTLCTKFFGMENGPNLVIWFDPKEDSMKLLLFSFLFGIIHLFVGLAIRFYNLCKHHNFIGAFCDVIPVYVFVTGFAIIGKNFIAPVSEKVKTVGYILLLVGAVLIILTSGRSAKNILGKLGGGLYGLYNTTTGYMSDILSYSRLLALNLVTSVIAMVVNLLAAMFNNIIIFIIIFLVGHAINLAINLIGTYVHTSRLQYVEFFSKFYNGGGRSFTPLRINSKYFKLKEETING